MKDHIVNTLGSLKVIAAKTGRVVAWPWVDCRSPWVPARPQKRSPRWEPCQHDFCQFHSMYYGLYPNDEIRCSLAVFGMQNE
jgi:hypothetical protein